MRTRSASAWASASRSESPPRSASGRPRRRAGGATARFAASSVTPAPRRRASSASATPIRPEERLPTKRTASSGSRVPPAETRTRLPARSGGASSCSTRRKMSSGSDMRPVPRLALGELALLRADQLDASFGERPDVRLRRRRATTCGGSSPARRASGPRCASAASVSTLSAIPCASFASVFAVHGATTSRSARSRCGYRSSPAGPPRERVERLRRDELLRPARDERHDVVPRLDEQPRQLASLVSGDASGDAEQDLRHGQFCPLPVGGSRACRLLTREDEERASSSKGTRAKRACGLLRPKCSHFGRRGATLALRVAVLELALGDLFEGHRQVVLASATRPEAAESRRTCPRRAGGGSC